MDSAMEHLNGIELVDYIGGQLSSDRQREIAAHLNTCGECRRRCLEVRQNWRLLGEWQTDLAHPDHPAPARKAAGPDYLADADVTEAASADRGRDAWPHGEAVTPPELGWLLPMDPNVPARPADRTGRAPDHQAFAADNAPPTRLRRLMRAARAAGAAMLAATTGRPPTGRGADRAGFGD
jgi:anti-sigma factor RsiW